MKIYRNAVEIADVKATDASYQDASIMGDNSVTIDFYSITQVDIRKGDYCNVYGERYAVKERPIPAIERGVYHYNFKLLGAIYEFEKVKMFLHDGSRDLTRSEFDYTCTPSELVQMIVRNLNAVQPFGWVVGTIVAGDVKTVSISRQNCLEVLQNAAKAWDTEFWTNGYTVNLCSRQSGSAPYRVLEIGEGLISIDQEKNTSQKTITRLYATGSTKNLPGGYGSPKLKMDVPYLEVAGAPYVIEDLQEFPEVYPRRVGSISEVRSTEKGIYFFKDAALEFDPNDFEVSALKKHVIFQSGPLIGLDFGVNFDTDEKEFKLIAYDESDGFRLPAGPMVPGINNTYIIYNISMPTSYVTAAEAELKAKAQAYLNTNAADLISLNLTTDEVYFTRNDVSIAPGETVTVKNENIDTLIAGRNIRVTAFKRYLNHKNKYENLKVSDVVYINPISEIQNKTKEIERVIDRAGMTEPNYFARNWRDVAEIANMINTLAAEMLVIGKIEGQFSLNGTFFTANAGGNQNRFMASAGILEHTTIPDDIEPGLWSIAPCDLILESATTPYYLYARCSTETDQGTLIVSADPIIYDFDELWYHFLVGVISSVRVNSRTFQTVYGFTQISGNQIVTGKMQSADGFNYLDFDNNRFRIGNDSKGLDWNATTANKLTIKGGIVQSPSGITFPMTVFRGEFVNLTTYYQGDEVTYNGSSWIYTSNSPSVGVPGDNSPYWSLKTVRGNDGAPGSDGKSIEFIFKRSTTPKVPTQPSSTNTDDFVPAEWTDDQQGVTSTYQFEFVSKREKVNGNWGLFSVPALWAKYSFNGADGNDGIDGKSIEFIFKRSTTATVPATPSSDNTDDYIPSGWTDNQQGVNSTYRYEFVCKRVKVGSNWGLFSIPALWATYSVDGSPGLNAPYGVYRGEYDPAKIYYGNPARVDAVKYNGIYYIAISKYPDASFTNKVPTDVLYWKTFGAQFESVATDLLLSRQIVASEINTATITALGAITAGSFNLGSGKFVVDANGNLVAQAAEFTGATKILSTDGNSVANIGPGVFPFSGVGAGRFLGKRTSVGLSYGSYSEAQGGTFAYGVYGKASGASDKNYGGYFEGAVYCTEYIEGAKYIKLTPILNASVPINSIFIDLATKRISFKNESGTAFPIDV